MNKKLAYLFAVLILGLFVISACEQNVGIKPAKNLRDLETPIEDNDEDYIPIEDNDEEIPRDLTVNDLNVNRELSIKSLAAQQDDIFRNAFACLDIQGKLFRSADPCR